MSNKIIFHSFPKEWEQMEIYPLNDLHIGYKHTDMKLFNQFKKFILEDERRFIICNGDLINNGIKTSISDVYEESINPREQKKKLVEELKPVKDRILGITTGNHEERSSKLTNQDVSEDVAESLGLSHLYSNNGLFIKVSLGERADKTRQITYLIHAFHGVGGGKKSGSSINNLEDYALGFEGVDIFTMAHVHKKIGSKFVKNIVDTKNNVFYSKEQLCVIASGWQDWGGYAQRFMLKGSPKGATKILLNGRKKEAVVKI
jgi:hypothetical protein